MSIPVPETEGDIGEIVGELIKFQREESSYNLYQFKRFVSANQYRRLYRVFQTYVSKGQDVLDWGCGNGHFSYFLLRSGYKVSGFSFKDFRLYSKLRSLGYQLKKGTAKQPIQIPFSDSSFDAVASVGVLEHVRETGGDENASLREISRVLRPGGFFICYHFPNRFSIIDFAGRCFPGKHRHPYRYTRKSIGNLCRQTGFELLEGYRYALLPRNLWGTFPKAIANSRVVAGIWNFLDDALRYPFSPICQNHLFVARKPDETSAVRSRPELVAGGQIPSPAR